METPYPGSPEDPRTAAWVCYFTFIGWLIAYFLLYRNNRSVFNGFHIRQALMIHILSLVVKIIYSFVSWSIGMVSLILLFVVWIIAFLDSLNNRMRSLPVIGHIAQRAFRRL